ncbi:MAG: riboflavin kinase, partial [Lentisphaeria bacterium]|nr:riboflavin kinase [Lentisphaeria bacterium]
TGPGPSVRHQEGLVSSTRIRQAVGQGDLAAAAAMLGRPFSLLGRVVHGYGQGSTVLQCPTANLIAENTILPPYGVYAATAQDRERQFRGIVYVGDAPTLRHDSRPRVYVELHLFDCNYDLYDRELHVEFRLFLRPSRKFSSPEELKAQIDRDIKAALAGPW